MVFKLKFKSRIDKDKALEIEKHLISLFHNPIDSQKVQKTLIEYPKNKVDKESINSQLSTICLLIKLLSRKRQNNSLHMEMIMRLSDRLNSLYAIFYKTEEFKVNSLFESIKTDLLLASCMETMISAEKKSNIFTDENYCYCFKDEKEVIREYFAKVNEVK